MTRVAVKPRSYPAKVVDLARRMYASGYSPYRIHKELKKAGYGAAEDTIRCWVDPAYAEARRLAKRTGRLPRQERRRGFNRRWSRMRELREEVGLSYRSIAALMTNDFAEVEITEEQVRAIFNGRLSEGKTRRLLWPESEPA